jgi:hypothetical protein
VSFERRLAVNEGESYLALLTGARIQLGVLRTNQSYSWRLILKDAGIVNEADNGFK